MSRYTAVPAPFRFRFTTGHVDLCNACAGVLLVEGALVSPPTDPEPLTMAGWTRTDPAPASALCDGCEAAADLEAHSAVLRAPPARLAVRELEAALNSF